MRAEYRIQLREPHDKQRAFLESKAKRKIIRAGRRGGKTTGIAILAMEQFLAGHRVLYATPTGDQIQRFWTECTMALSDLLDDKIFIKNETLHTIERKGSEQRIRAKTAWNADTLRGDYADVLILDEWQLMNEEAWQVVGAPMLMDNNGDAVFIYTPPSFHSRSVSKANDPQHASKLYKTAEAEMRLAAAEGRASRWAAFHFTSLDNPHLSTEGLSEASKDMSYLAYRQEILAEDIGEVPGALWTREIIERNRVTPADVPHLARIGVGVDPSISDKEESDECGIICAGTEGVIPNRPMHGYILGDYSKRDSPKKWAQAVVHAFHDNLADLVIAEANQGGQMVAQTIHSVDPDVPVRLVHASRSKQTRAEPVSAIYEGNRVHHVGVFAKLEDEMVSWIPGRPSPNRMDAAVHLLTALLIGRQRHAG